ncbi:hypothetical protein AB6A40_006018 [Gnathostoma spinigerum]|uniref:Bestrophin homolog n=1 Tax=Gnathostoma spinigerum TaxID=75299 RepID=A0ABD6EPT3_9BILA
MTVSYNVDVIKTTRLLGFLKLECRWRGSVWKQTLFELLVFTVAYVIIGFIYRTDLLLNNEQKEFFVKFAKLFDQRMNYVPLTFMLGFFVNIIVGRWNDIFKNMGWIDNTALYVATYVRGADEQMRIVRRNIIRYLVLTQTLVFRDISMQVRKRFPTPETLVAAGLISKKELECYETIEHAHSKYWLPVVWCHSLLYQARTDGKIASDVQLNNVIEQIRQFRTGLGRLCNYDWVPVPLVYPQVVFFAVRAYFFLCLVARQSVDVDGHYHGGMSYMIVPYVMTALQFIFYTGWMKVAESLMNPLGEDDDDFECNFLIDRNLKVGLNCVDAAYDSKPVQEKDSFWGTKPTLLYSADSAVQPIFPFLGSVSHFELPPNVNEVIMMPHQNQRTDAGNLITDEIQEGFTEDEHKPFLVPKQVSVSVRHVTQDSVQSQTSGNSLINRFRRTFSRSSTRFLPTHRSVNKPLLVKGKTFGRFTTSTDKYDEEAEQHDTKGALRHPEHHFKSTPPDAALYPLESIDSEKKSVDKKK